MRKKLFIGVFLAAIVSIVAGEYLFNRSGAQDAPKKVDEKKVEPNLFDVLKKDLDAKKEVPPPADIKLPPLAPLEAKDLVIPPPASLPNDKKDPLPVPPLPTVGAKEKTPDVGTVPPPLIFNDLPKPKPTVEEPKPMAVPTLPQAKDATVPLPPVTTQPKETPSLPPLTTQPKETPPPILSTKPAEPRVAVDPILPSKPEVPREIVPPFKPAVEVSPSVKPAAPIQDQLASLNGSPWSFHVEVVEGKTYVTAIINKKHEFKIVCDKLNLQTPTGLLEATGKVQISGDALNGTCGRLAITLADDRLVLSNQAEMRIQKATTLVSDANPGVFELKGETLNLRIGELESGKFLQTSFRRPDPANTKQAIAVPPLSDAKRWSPYGKLVRVESKLGAVYNLESSSGQVLLELVAREGGSLERFVGQTISVYGTNERTAGGNAVLRVTHIALP